MFDGILIIAALVAIADSFGIKRVRISTRFILNLDFDHNKEDDIWGHLTIYS